MNYSNQKICFVLGTRPELIKMAPVIRACVKRGVEYFVIHTGQHYSYEMDEIFIRDLALGAPKYNLAVGSGSHGKQTARMLDGIESILEEEKPTVVLVQGDTNSVLAGALAATKLHIPVGHIEAGLRSFDREMPEEVNRILTDHISDYLFAPTETGRQHLLREGIADELITVTGNTIVDSALQSTELASRLSNVLAEHGLLSKQYLLLTIHRAENTDSADRLRQILEGVRLVSMHVNVPIVWPMHPRTQQKITQYGLSDLVKKIANLTLIDPVGFLDFIHLERHAKLAITDSGGVQEEACILGTPCVTVRTSTERPETVVVGSNIIAGRDPDAILESVLIMLKSASVWNNPFGDGAAGLRIVDTLLRGTADHYSDEKRGVVEKEGDVMSSR